MKIRAISKAAALVIIFLPYWLSASYCAFFNVKNHKEYDFLSNFYVDNKPIHSPWGDFKCAEGLYQYQKFAHLHNQKLKDLFCNAAGQEAYDTSRAYKSEICSDWDRVAAMELTLRYKFEDRELQKKLLDTHDAYLVENCPLGHDHFWADNGDGTGKNMLGILLMELRQKLGGTGVVPMPDILKKFYASKCFQCGNPCYFTNNTMIYNRCVIIWEMSCD